MPLYYNRAVMHFKCTIEPPVYFNKREEQQLNFFFAIMFWQECYCSAVWMLTALNNYCCIR